MLNPDLEQEHGWAIEAFRGAFGHGGMEVLHERRGRSLKVRVGEKEFTLYEAATTGGEPFSINAQRNRLSLVEQWIADVRG